MTAPHERRADGIALAKELGAELLALQFDRLARCSLCTALGFVKGASRSNSVIAERLQRVACTATVVCRADAADDAVQHVSGLQVTSSNTAVITPIANIATARAYMRSIRERSASRSGEVVDGVRQASDLYGCLKIGGGLDALASDAAELFVGLLARQQQFGCGFERGDRVDDLVGGDVHVKNPASCGYPNSGRSRPQFDIRTRGLADKRPHPRFTSALRAMNGLRHQLHLRFTITGAGYCLISAMSVHLRTVAALERLDRLDRLDLGRQFHLVTADAHQVFAEGSGTLQPRGAHIGAIARQDEGLETGHDVDRIQLLELSCEALTGDARHQLVMRFSALGLRVTLRLRTLGDECRCIVGAARTAQRIDIGIERHGGLLVPGGWSGLRCDGLLHEREQLTRALRCLEAVDVAEVRALAHADEIAAQLLLGVTALCEAVDECELGGRSPAVVLRAVGFDAGVVHGCLAAWL
ncbi:conserved hypothetical protein [Ricinus communis]|uniref:Uncharacterized protein n=1 Tax=Ricinus communis TaxID=3988 RepID=B9T8K5_RICCO|nr:conserved hypothetical protein [Ricinus communis]